MKKEWILLAAKILIVAAVIMGLFTFVFGMYRNPDETMSPSLRNGDLLFYDRLTKEYQPQDVVVIKKDGEMQIRRVIARSGDVVDLTENGLTINGYLQQEPGIYTETLPYKEGITFPITVEKDAYFVLGDHRPGTKDSRIYGTVHRKEIKGCMMTLIRRRGF